MLRRHQPLPCNPQLVRAGADGSGEPALPMRQGALKDICATTAGIPPKAPSGALARWQPATFVQQEKAVLATACSLLAPRTRNFTQGRMRHRPHALPLLLEERARFVHNGRGPVPTLGLGGGERRRIEGN